MKTAGLSLVALGLIASTCALPVGTGSGVDLIPGYLNTWKQEFALAGQRISIGFGYKKNGTIAASACLIANIDGKTSIPIGAAITTNINNAKNVQYQVGAQILDKITGIVWGDTSGDINYMINAWPIQVSSEGKGVNIGVGLEGDGLKPELLGAAVGYGSEVANLQVGLGSNYVPDSVNVVLSGDTADIPS